MECERTRQWVSAALDSELSQFERALVTGHVARCAACRAFADRVTEVTVAVRSSPPQKLSARIYLPARRRLAWRTQAGVARLGSVAAVVVTAISVGLLAGPDSGTLGSEQRATLATAAIFLFVGAWLILLGILADTSVQLF